eukprot:m.107489 g.107489  ORF g.107489 m.107489 type:complete len:136 (+) comp15843_c0_seq4:83-490(+)
MSAERLPNELLLIVFESLPVKDLVSAAQVCQRWADVGEILIRKHCVRQKKRLPRMPRGESSKTFWPWRTLLISVSCKSCRQSSQLFPLMRQPDQVFYGFLCKQCVLEKPKVKALMARRFLSVATTNLQGEKLLKS